MTRLVDIQPAHEVLKEDRANLKDRPEYNQQGDAMEWDDRPGVPLALCEENRGSTLFSRHPIFF